MSMLKWISIASLALCTSAIVWGCGTNKHSNPLSNDGDVAGSSTGGSNNTAGSSGNVGELGGSGNSQGGEGGSSPTNGGSSNGGVGGSNGGANNGGSSTGGTTNGGTSGVGGSGGTSTGGNTSTGGDGGATSGPTISTDANLKVAFVGDTTSGTTWQSVLNLIKNEGAAGMVVEGDMSYADDPAAWWSTTESVLGTDFPIFLSRGNHDDGTWAAYLPKASDHLGGATRVDGAHDANYKTTWRGLVIATIRKGDSGANITPLLQNEDHIWKICNWHQNQAALQVGDKGDEMGWDVYETCRQLGAIIETGHEHSYHRTKTLIDMTQQTVDSTCSDPAELCVSPGRTFAQVVGLGGQSIRPQVRCMPTAYPYGCNGAWAFIYTSNQNANYGAQFITFNAGDPKKANGYFKNIDNQVVDTFNVTYGP